MRVMRETKLKAARLRAGMSKAELARAAHMDAGMIAWIENGRFVPYPSQLEKLAAALSFAGDPSELGEYAAVDVYGNRVE